MASGTRILGTFSCRGKVSEQALEILSRSPEHELWTEMAVTARNHPDRHDLEDARAFARWQAHWHQYEGDWWIRTLAAYGLTVDHLEPYLSREAFLWFRLFAAPTFRLLERVAGPVLWWSWAPLLERLIVESVQPAEGACWLFLARKKNK